jgi:hypothetical protein
MNESPEGKVRSDLNFLCQSMHHPSIYEIFFLIIHFFSPEIFGVFMWVEGRGVLRVMTGKEAHLPPITRHIETLQASEIMTIFVLLLREKHDFLC